MAVEKPAATVIAETLGVRVADLDGNGTIDVVGDGPIEYGEGTPVRISGADSGRGGGFDEEGNVIRGGKPARYIRTTIVNVDGRAVVADGVDSRNVVARNGIVGTFPMARYFGPDGARALLGKKEGDVAAYGEAVKKWGDTRFAGNATLAVEAAARGGFLDSVAPEVRTAALTGAQKNVAAALSQVQGGQGDMGSNMGVYENSVRTVALLGRGDTNKPVMGEGKGAVAAGRTLNETHLAMQQALLDKGVQPRNVGQFVERVARATKGPVPIVAALQPLYGNQATVSPK